MRPGPSRTRPLRPFIGAPDHSLGTVNWTWTRVDMDTGKAGMLLGSKRLN